MRIVLHDDAGPGQWDVVCGVTRRSETEPTRLKLAALLMGIALDWVNEEALLGPAPAPEEAPPQIALPGIDFPSGGLPKLPPR